MNQYCPGRQGRVFSFELRPALYAWAITLTKLVVIIHIRRIATTKNGQFEKKAHSSKPETETDEIGIIIHLRGISSGQRVRFGHVFQRIGRVDILLRFIGFWAYVVSRQTRYHHSKPGALLCRTIFLQKLVSQFFPIMTKLVTTQNISWNVLLCTL